MTPQEASKIASLVALPDDWDGYGAPTPSAAAGAAACRILSNLPDSVPRPSRIVPDSGGGLVLYWFDSGKRSAIFISNGSPVQGPALIGMNSDLGGGEELWDVPTVGYSATLRKIANFISHPDLA